MLKLIGAKKKKPEKEDRCEICGQIFGDSKDNTLVGSCLECGKWLCAKCCILVFEDEAMDGFTDYCAHCLLELTISDKGFLIFKPHEGQSWTPQYEGLEKK